MGVVWRARDQILDRDVAVEEVVISSLLDEEERRNAYQRTLREARTAARLSHRGLVAVYDVAEEDGRPWIVMELVPSRSLDQVLTVEGRLPPLRVARIGQQLLSALGNAQLKPSRLSPPPGPGAERHAHVLGGATGHPERGGPPAAIRMGLPDLSPAQPSTERPSPAPPSPAPPSPARPSTAQPSTRHRSLALVHLREPVRRNLVRGPSRAAAVGYRALSRPVSSVHAGLGRRPGAAPPATEVADRSG